MYLKNLSRLHARISCVQFENGIKTYFSLVIRYNTIPKLFSSIKQHKMEVLIYWTEQYLLSTYPALPFANPFSCKKNIKDYKNKSSDFIHFWLQFIDPVESGITWGETKNSISEINSGFHRSEYSDVYKTSTINPLLVRKEHHFIVLINFEMVTLTQDYRHVSLFFKVGG